MKEQYDDRIKALVSVLEEDQVTMTVIVKNRVGNVLFQNKQLLTECPEFIKLKNRAL